MPKKAEGVNQAGIEIKKPRSNRANEAAEPRSRKEQILGDGSSWPPPYPTRRVSQFPEQRRLCAESAKSCDLADKPRKTDAPGNRVSDGGFDRGASVVRGWA